MTLPIHYVFHPFFPSLSFSAKAEDLLRLRRQKAEEAARQQAPALKKGRGVWTSPLSLSFIR